MSLNWNCKVLTDRGINIWTNDPALGGEDDQQLNPVTNSLIWATLVVGCDGRKIDTFTKRIREYELASGPLLHAPDPKNREKAVACNYLREDTITSKGYISKAELLRHDGFSTNASPLTDAQWAKKLAALVSETAGATLRVEK